MYTFKEIDENEYQLDDQFSKEAWKYVRKKPINTMQKDNRNCFVYKNNLTSDWVYFGEVIGSKMAEKIMGVACATELAKRKRFHKDIYDNGVISYYYFAEGDKRIASAYILQEYYHSENRQRDFIPTIDTIIKAFAHIILQKYQRPYAEYEAVKQQYIDMLVFDCKFGNYDRHQENWMLYQDGVTSEVKMYPMYDNESVLGFDEEVYLEDEKIIRYCQKQRLCHIASQKETHEYSTYEEIITYLLTNYSTETRRSLEKMKKFSLEDLSELLDEFPDLPEDRKVFAKKMFITRDILLQKYQEELEKKHEGKEK